MPYFTGFRKCVLLTVKTGFRLFVVNPAFLTIPGTVMPIGIETRCEKALLNQGL
jgi:hypothetical protein